MSRRKRKATRHNYSRPVVSDELMGGESTTVSHRIVKPCRLEALDYSGEAFKVAVRVGRRAAKPGMKLKAGDVVKFLLERSDEPVRVNAMLLGAAIVGNPPERGLMPLPFHPADFKLGERRMLEASPQRDFYIQQLLVAPRGGRFFSDFVVHGIFIDDGASLLPHSLPADFIDNGANLLPHSLPADVFSYLTFGIRLTGLPGPLKAGKRFRLDVERPHVPLAFRATIRLSRPKVKR